jgi:hypothetical protein
MLSEQRQLLDENKIKKTTTNNGIGVGGLWTIIYQCLQVK